MLTRLPLTKLLSYAGAIALIIPTTACMLSPNLETESDSVAESLEARSDYSEIPLPSLAQRSGDNPEQIALNAFGIVEEPREGNFAQEVTTVEQTPTMTTVMLTQTGLLDDSVEGMRYWLEFVAEGETWEMVWAGRQVRCYLNRGPQDWSAELCS